MSYFIDNAFVTKYQEDFHIVAQQRKSRLEPFAKKRISVVGESFTVDVLDQAEGYTNRARHSDIIYDNVENTRRLAYMKNFTDAVLLDDEDKLKMLINPVNSYTQSLISAGNRWLDKEVLISAALGTATTLDGNRTFGSAALPAGQQIANGGTGLTVAKLRQAKILLDDAEMDDSDYFANMGQHEGKQDPYGNLNMPSYIFVTTSNGIDDLLGTTEATSVDYNSVKALVAGAVNTFMGFLFVRVPPSALPKVGNVRTSFAYAPRAIEYGIGKNMSAMIERVPTKNAYQILVTGSMGAVRAEDEGVVSVDFVE